MSKSNPLHPKDRGASVAAELAAQVKLLPPEQSLVFSTRPAYEPTYQVDLGEFAEGPTHPRALPFAGRPALIQDIAPYLTTMLSCAPQVTARNTVQSMRVFWRFLDTLPEALPSARLSDINEIVGALWYRFEPGHKRYTVARRVINGARELHGLDYLYWPSAPRPTTNEAKPVCQLGVRRLYHALKFEAGEILRHWDRGAELASAGANPGPVGSEGWERLENQAWALRQAVSVSDPTSIDIEAVGKSSPLQRRPLNLHIRGNEPLKNKLAWFYPTRTQASVFQLLFLLQSGWN
jgi:hypothetical protein